MPGYTIPKQEPGRAALAESGGVSRVVAMTIIITMTMTMTMTTIMITTTTDHDHHHDVNRHDEGFEPSVTQSTNPFGPARSKPGSIRYSCFEALTSYVKGILNLAEQDQPTIHGVQLIPLRQSRYRSGQR